ncbi:MAG TPA: cupin domain-containing protein [Melioribacteraceae bacterium]|nr:cupin domain-containing protein [Melioribacteraceae bacterium]
MIEIKNIYNTDKINLVNEYFEDIIKQKGFRLERIISYGHVTPNEYWYDQDEDEFVLLLKGNAKLQFEDGNVIELSEGDYIIIPKHVKHRVIYTNTQTNTFWLTCYYKNEL